MKYLLADIETDGLKPNVVWVCVTKDVETGEIKTWERPDKNSEDFNKYIKPYILVFHNGLFFDVPVLNRLCKSGINPERVIDTLVLSRLVNSWDYNTHSLASWGERLGLPKTEFNDWDKLTPEMVEYCKNDVLVLEKIFNFLKPYLDKHEKAVLNEHRAAILCTEMHYNGFGFDIERCKQLFEDISSLKNDIERELQEAFPPRSYCVREILPVATKSGRLHSKDFRWLTGDPEEQGYAVNANFSLVGWEPFNPASPKQVIERLNEYGWKPFEKTKGHIKAERERDHKKLEEYKTYGWTISEDNLKTLPPDAPQAAHKIVRYVLLTRRLTTLEEWIDAYNPDTSSIHGQINAIGTWPHRASHKNPNTGNIIRVAYSDTKEPLFGEVGGWGADYRSLWRARPGYKLVGCDAEGIQLRVLAHYMEDEEFTKALISGSSKDGTAVHTLNQKKLNSRKFICKTRDDSKTFIYSWVLGAAAPKTASVLQCSVPDAVIAREDFLNGYPGLKRVKEVLIPEDVKRGQFIGFDGRPVKCDSAHLMLAGYLQNGETCIMKYAGWLLRTRLKKEKVPFKFVNFVHDEFQFEVIDKEDLPRLAGEIAAECIVQAGIDLGVKCPQAGNYKVGNNWLETH